MTTVCSAVRGDAWPFRDPMLIIDRSLPVRLLIAIKGRNWLVSNVSKTFHVILSCLTPWLVSWARDWITNQSLQRRDKPESHRFSRHLANSGDLWNRWHRKSRVPRMPRHRSLSPIWNKQWVKTTRISKDNFHFRSKDLKRDKLFHFAWTSQPMSYKINNPEIERRINEEQLEKNSREQRGKIIWKRICFKVPPKSNNLAAGLKARRVSYFSNRATTKAR